MTDIKRLTELAGLNEYIPSDKFIEVDRVAGDALSAYQGKNNTDSLEKVVNYYAMKSGVDEEQLLATVSGYLKNPESLMPGGNVNQIGEDNFTTQPTGTVVNEPMDDMPGELEGLEGPWRMKNGRVVYYDPKEGKYYDRGTDMYLSQEEVDALHQGRINEYDDETITFSVKNEKGYNAIMDRYNEHISWDGEYMVVSEIVFAQIEDLFASMGIDGPYEVGSEDDYDGQPDERQEWQDYMGGDDWDQGQYDESVDFGKKYEEYKEQLAFEEFEQAMQEAVTFAGGEPPQTRAAAQAGRYTKPGTFDISKDITDKPTEPHAKTVISDKEPWEYTGDLGSSLGLKQKINPEDYASVLSRDFHKWAKGSDLKSNKTRTVYDKTNNKQIKSTVWNPRGRHEDIVAFEILSGSGGNFAPGVYVRKDAAPPEMIRRGRESGR